MHGEVRLHCKRPVTRHIPFVTSMCGLQLMEIIHEATVLEALAVRHACKSVKPAAMAALYTAT